MDLSWESVLAWRLRRQLLEPAGRLDAPDIARRLCGVQAQVPSAAELAVAVRQKRPKRGEVDKALANHTLMRTWAMRGTLHLLHPADAGAYLSLLAAARTWEKGAWQRNFITTKQIAALADAVWEALEGAVLTREELTAAVVERTSDAGLVEHLTSGWSAVLKPLAWQGYLCNGPSEGNRVTFTRPDTWIAGWAGIPEADDAARTVIPAYLAAHGPAPMPAFDQWLTRGATPKATLRRWFADLGDDLATVDVEGRQCYALAAHVDEIAATKPSEVVRLLPAFDQYVLGPGTKDTSIVAAQRRPEVSRTAGWISPVVVAGGRVAGTWQVNEDAAEVVQFGEAGAVDGDGLSAEVARIGGILGRELRLSVQTA